MGTGKSNKIDWQLTSEKPIAGSRVIAETLDGEYIEEQISDEVFDIWDESIIRWAYSPSWFDEFFSKQMNSPKEDEKIDPLLFKEFVLKQMNLPKEDKKEEKNDKKLQEDILDVMLYGSLLWFLLSDDSDSNAKCRECCCDGLDDSQDDKMDELRSRLSKSDKNKNKRTSDGEDSSKSEPIPEMYKRYTRLRNAIYYGAAGTIGADGLCFTRRNAVKRVLECAPELEAAARYLDAWYFFD